MATSSCTGAIHLALLSLGLKAGDEVLVPENTWVATGIVPTYLGVKPVFVDIEPDTWLMSPESILRHITPKTRAILPVHLYGAPCNMSAILEIANAKGLRVIEDAAPSCGAMWAGRKTGSFGDASAFSFQGAKLLVSGEGGMFCTNDETVYKKAQYLNDYAVDTNKSFWIDEAGYKYRMSNLQASLALAQLSRVEELVARKRQIFSWYAARLQDLEGFALNAEKPDSRNIYWMTSLILPEGFPLGRDEFRSKLKARHIDTRPFFHPMSSLPMFTSQRAENPVAYDISERGINLPSGHNLTEDDVDYVCETIREIVGKGSGYAARSIDSVGPLGKLLLYKNRPIGDSLTLPFKTECGKPAALRMVTYDDLQDASSIELLARWRERANENFPAQFQVTLEGTKKWLKDAVLNVRDRVLFWVIDTTGNRVGHVGLFRFALDFSSCEIDNIVRGERSSNRRLMDAGLMELLSWQRSALRVPESYLRVFHDNERAMSLYSRLGYHEIQRVPLKRVQTDSGVEWREIAADPHRPAEKYFVTMKQSLSEGGCK